MRPHLPEVGESQANTVTSGAHGSWVARAVPRRFARGPCRSGGGGLPLRLSFRGIAVAGAAVLLAACAREVSTAVHPQAPGFLLGLWHGFIFPLSWIGSLFSNDIAIYAVPNNGGWYDFGYFLGIVVFGVGARKTTTIYRDRVIYRDRAIDARKIN